MFRYKYKLRGMEHSVKWQRLCVLNYIIQNIIVCEIEFSTKMLKAPWYPDSQDMKTNWWLWCGKRKEEHIEYTLLHMMTRRLCSVSGLCLGLCKQASIALVIVTTPAIWNIFFLFETKCFFLKTLVRNNYLAKTHNIGFAEYRIGFHPTCLHS